MGRGFSLLEVLIAIGVISFAIVSILGVYALTVGNAGKLRNSSDAVSLSEGMHAYLQSRPFDEIADWIRQSSQGALNSPLYIYQYRAQAQGNTMVPQAQLTGIALNDYQLLVGVRRDNDPALAGELAAREGRLVAVYLRYSGTNPTINTLSLSDFVASTSTTFTQAAFLCQADYYAVSEASASPPSAESRIFHEMIMVSR